MKRIPLSAVYKKHDTSGAMKINVASKIYRFLSEVVVSHLAHQTPQCKLYLFRPQPSN